MLKTSFWNLLDKPIIGLSPMDGVTDYPYRYIQKKYGNPAVIYTEFTSVEGVCHGALRLLRDFLFDETQRSIVAQIYGTTPDYFRQTTILLCQLGFDGIDINMGCPAKNVAHTGAGAALIKNPDLAKKIVAATKLGVNQWLNGATVRDCGNISTEVVTEVEKRHQLLPTEFRIPRNIPVSVKTRIGYSKPMVSEWIPILLETEPAVIALHGRTLSQHYSGQASWEAIAQASEIVKKSQTLLLGNGDVSSLEDALKKIQETSIDGVLIGRASFGNPLIFNNTTSHPQPSIFEIALEHARLFETIYQNEEKYNFMQMRKHLGWYVRSIPQASEIRAKLFQTDNSQQVSEIFSEYGLIA